MIATETRCNQLGRDTRGCPIGTDVLARVEPELEGISSGHGGLGRLDIPHHSMLRIGLVAFFRASY